jgi:hypothetical protein
MLAKDSYYRKISDNILLDLLSNPEISEGLAYMVDFNPHKRLITRPNEYYIEISNDEITIAVILYVGFEENDFLKLSERKNLHVVTFSEVVPDMEEFKNIKVKFIDTTALMLTVMARSKNEFVRYLYRLKNFTD